MPTRLESFTAALPVAAALSLLPSTAEAGGDSVYGNRGGDLMREQEHRIELTFARGHVELKVRRTVHNGIERHDEAQFWINLPYGAVATGLRSLGEAKGKPKWFEAELLEAEAAAARYLELTGVGGYYPKDPALLSWRDPTLLALQVFPVAPKSDKTVAYDLIMPAVWEDGRWRIELPSLGTDTMPAELIIRSDEALDQLFVDDGVVANGHFMTLDRDVALSLAPTNPSPISLSLASVETGAQHLAHWRVTLAPEMSTLPQQAKIVLVLDLSRSNGEDEIGAQRELALAYLAHFQAPALGAEVAVLGFDREVHALTPGFVSATEATKLLESATLTRRNGSEIGLALEQADALLSKAGKGPRRVVVLSDLETAQRVTPHDLTPTLAHSKAIVHFVDVSTDSEASLDRDDSHDWSALAASTTGVVWQAGAPEQWDDDDARSYGIEVFEELARPVRIDDFSLDVTGLSQYVDCCTTDTTLDEGQGIDSLMLAPVGAGELIVSGRTWNSPLRETAKPSKREGDRWAAMVFGTELLGELSEPEMMTLAMRGGAVSPVTSYLAIEPGVRPSTEGLEAWESGGIGLIGSGWGSGGGSGFGGRGSARPSFDKQAWLEQELRDGWERCGGRNVAGEVGLETRTGEIVDVTLTSAQADAGVRGCMLQVAWSVELPREFSAVEQWVIVLST